MDGNPPDAASTGSPESLLRSPLRFAGFIAAAGAAPPVSILNALAHAMRSQPSVDTKSQPPASITFFALDDADGAPERGHPPAGRVTLR